MTTKPSTSKERIAYPSRRQILRGGTMLALASGVSGFPAIVRPASAKKFLKPIVAGLNGKEGDPSYDSIALMPKILREKYDVEMEFQIHPSQTLGSLESQAQGVMTGFIDITSFSSSQFAVWTNAYDFIDLPYMIPSWEMAERFFKSDLLRKQSAVVEKAIPVKVMPPVGAGGFRMLWTRNQQLRTPDDVNNRRFRVTASPIEMELIRAWKGSPTPVPFNEAYVALQQGVIDGMYVQPIWNYNFKFFEVVKHGTHVDAHFAVQVQIINANTFGAMPEPMQKAFMLAAQDATDIANPRDRALEAQFTQQIAGKGTAIYTPSSVEMAKWREAGQSVWSKAKVDSSLIKEMQALS